MSDDEKTGHYLNEKGEVEYFPLITINGKDYNLIALKALLLAVKNFKISITYYDGEYYGKKYTFKKYTITSYGGRKRRK